MSSTIQDLTKLISDSVATLAKVSAEDGFSLPGFNDPFIPAAKGLHSNPLSLQATQVIVAAATQLIALVSPPPAVALQFGFSTAKGAALRVCLEANVPEILRDAGPQGLHVRDIGAKCGLNSDKLSRFLRCLASSYVFQEISLDVFANNRISMFLDKRKPLNELEESPLNRHDNTAGFCALLEHHLDTGFKSAAQILEAMKDPAMKDSEETNHSPFNIGLNTTDTFFNWLDKPEQEYTLKRFGAAMKGVAGVMRPDNIPKTYDFASLPEKSLVVDVGGGVGSASLQIAKAFPHLNIVVQDRASVIENGLKVWGAEQPKAIDSGRVKFQAHDFFDPQPIKDAAVFFLKSIIHDWSDKYAAKILIQLREAAAPNTKLIIMDIIVPYACRSPKLDILEGVEGADLLEAPEPLLPNFGAANDRPYVTDMFMYLFQNSQERTLHHFAKLLQKSGWRLVRVRRIGPAGAYIPSIEAVPA